MLRVIWMNCGHQESNSADSNEGIPGRAEKMPSAVSRRARNNFKVPSGGSTIIRRQGPWRGLDDVELATLTWVAWYNADRLLEPLGYIPPAEFEQTFYEGQAGAGQPAILT